jgi:hypothetical protein
MLDKTLIGKDNYLFLINDACNELEVHCNNLILIKDTNLSNINFDKYMIIIFPNKSLYYKEYLPDKYTIKYRPGLDIYKKKLGNKCFDGYDVLKNIDDAYYKTDTHINLKGNYNIYLEFVKKCNYDYNMNLIPKTLVLKKKDIELSSLNIGIGDLTWSNNLGEQILDDKKDTYYYSEELEQFYMKHIIKNNDKYIFYDFNMQDKSLELENKIVDWNIISSHIIYKNNNYKTKNKVIIFYDSFLLSIIPLIIDLFNEVYMIKKVYDNNLINLINPDYVFEFRVERFLL